MRWMMSSCTLTWLVCLVLTGCGAPKAMFVRKDYKDYGSGLEIGSYVVNPENPKASLHPQDVPMQIIMDCFEYAKPGMDYGHMGKVLTTPESVKNLAEQVKAMLADAGKVTISRTHKIGGFGPESGRTMTGSVEFELDKPKNLVCAWRTYTFKFGSGSRGNGDFKNFDLSLAVEPAHETEPEQPRVPSSID